MSKVVLLLGSNLGNRKNFLDKAIELIKSEVGFISKVSSIYESEPWGFNSNNLFLNQVIIIESTYQPQTILKKLQQIEKELGKKIKSPTYQNRTIDIDILFYDEIQMESENLKIPHPRLHLRQFTMIPLVEIAGDYIHPVLGQRLDMLATNSTDNKTVKVFEYVKPALTPTANEV
ncbi:MAG: 2-amino-4-hydroxy-6-hydroxymethyldihydropteridine diphosphokinase [Bacteroidales bacterium]|nr:2-amino-4-hydroxy-6-hydroxymethyldihydropteridine diphosphokinase [Bacteroidales bacterium]